MIEGDLCVSTFILPEHGVRLVSLWGQPGGLWELSRQLLLSLCRKHWSEAEHLAKFDLCAAGEH